MFDFSCFATRYITSASNCSISQSVLVWSLQLASVPAICISEHSVAYSAGLMPYLTQMASSSSAAEYALVTQVLCVCFRPQLSMLSAFATVSPRSMGRRTASSIEMRLQAFSTHFATSDRWCSYPSWSSLVIGDVGGGVDE